MNFYASFGGIGLPSPPSLEGPANMLMTVPNIKKYLVFIICNLQEVFRTMATRFGLFPAKTTKRVIKARFALLDIHTHTHVRKCVHSLHMKVACPHTQNMWMCKNIMHND